MAQASTIRQALGLLAWLGTTMVTGAIGAAATIDAPTFYASLQRPSWAPPSWLFGPVWTTLYILMGLAAWQVWRTSGWTNARTALSVYAGQLLLNAAWSWLFFSMQSGLGALIEIVILWLAIVATMVLFRRHSAVASYALLPYLLWVSFASALTFYLWANNPDLL